MTETIRAQLQDYAERALPAWPQPAVGTVTRITDGWECELYRFDLEYGPPGARERLGLVLRAYPGDGAARKAEHEFTGLQRLHQAGYPVPQVYHLALAGSPLGQPFVLMERIEGELLWPALETRSRAEQAELITLFCELMARLHRLDWRPFAADPARLEAAGPYVFVDAMLDDARTFVAHGGLPGFAPLVDWLAAHRAQAACARPAVTHRDFHPANVLLRADGSPVVIDWPNLAVTDARFDLSWTLMLVQSHVGRALRDTLLAGYEHASGAKVENLAYFEVHACGRRLTDVTISLTHGPERQGMRPEAVALMRAQLPSLAAVAEMLFQRTGLRVPEVEGLLRG
jgi:aminoglycoside phosphotransferase (APT) family kinase protein